VKCPECGKDPIRGFDWDSMQLKLFSDPELQAFNDWMKKALGERIPPYPFEEEE